MRIDNIQNALGRVDWRHWLKATMWRPTSFRATVGMDWLARAHGAWSRGMPSPEAGV